jgi:hypothetical protein
MSDAANRECQALLGDNVMENIGLTLHYLHMTDRYDFPRDRALIRLALKSAVMCIKAAARSFNELEALDAPAQMSEAAE